MLQFVVIEDLGIQVRDLGKAIGYNIIGTLNIQQLKVKFGELILLAYNATAYYIRVKDSNKYLVVSILYQYVEVSLY